jgi:hypothetical protein
MSGPLPAQPNLRQLKTRAKDLHKAHQQADPRAIERIAEHHPRLSGLPDANILEADFSLQDAQLIIAREYGFPSWPKLTASIAASTSTPNALSPEEAASLVRDLLAEGESQKAAMLLTALGIETTGESLKYMSDREIEVVVAAFAGLEDVPTEQRQKMIAEFEQHGGGTEPANGKFVPFAFAALQIAVGPHKGKRILRSRGIDIPLELPEPRPQQKTDEYLATKSALKQKLQNIPSLQMDLDALSEVIVGMAEIARVEGILSLEEMADESSRMENLLKDGIQLAVDGTEIDLVADLLTTKMQALVHSYETRCRMIIEGVKAIQNGENPRIVEHRLSSFYKPQAHL